MYCTAIVFSMVSKLEYVVKGKKIKKSGLVWKQ